MLISHDLSSVKIVCIVHVCIKMHINVSLSLQGSTGKPKLDDFNKFVRPTVARKWQDLGIELLSAVENGVAKLDIIRDNYQRDAEACCTEMFKYWLDNADDASWNRLVAAVEVIGYKVLAKELKGTYVITLENYT